MRSYSQSYERKLERYKAAQQYKRRRSIAGRKARERREFVAFLRSKADRAMDKTAAAWLADNGFR